MYVLGWPPFFLSSDSAISSFLSMAVSGPCYHWVHCCDYYTCPRSLIDIHGYIYLAGKIS